MKKSLAFLFSLLLLASVSSAIPFSAQVEDNQGYMTGTFYKDTDGQLYKVIYEDKDTIELGYFEDAVVARDTIEVFPATPAE